MSPTGRQLRPLKRNERRFLADQAADAKTAMARTLHDMDDTLQRVADVRSYAKQHPWLVVGCAATAGFVTGALLKTVPRKTINPGSSVEAESQRVCRGEETQRIKKSVLFSTAQRLLTGILQTVVTNVIAAAFIVQEQPQVKKLSPHDSTGEVEAND